MNKIKISAVIIARNEEEKIEDCLKSLNWVDEIILVDGSSSDGTVQLAKKFGANIFEFEGSDFAARRNFGTKQTKGEWILHLDADERVTPKLRKEIERIIGDKKNKFTHVAIPHQNYVFRKKMIHCGLFPDYVIRLFRKDKFIKWQGALHETVLVNGPLGYLNNFLVHIKHNNLADMVKKTNQWSEVEADLMFKAGHPPMNFPRFFSAISREFFLRMIKQTAFMDGTEGVIYGLYQVWSRFLSYAKLWEKQIRNGQKESYFSKEVN